MGRVLKHPATLNRAFEGAGIHPALSRWITSALPADADIRSGLRALRARSREAAQNDDHMRLFLRLVEANVIGWTGIGVQAKPTTLGGSPDRAATAVIEALWARQCRRGFWDVSGQHSRAGFSRLGVRTVAQDGEILIRLHEYAPDAPTGFAVELLDPESLDLEYDALLPNGNLIRMGVEMTPRRRPVAYWLFSEPASRGSPYRAGERTRVPAEEILHVYLPEWVWQSRGIPWAVSSLRRMHMLAGYEEAAITAARAAAVKSAAYVPQEWASTGAFSTGSRESPASQDLSPGAIEVVPYGWDLKTLDWGWPNTDHGQFVKAALRGIAGGLGVSYNGLANDLEGVNFSSLRQGALAERDLWTALQDWWIEWVERPIYERWVAFAWRNGDLRRRNGALYPPDRLESLQSANFQGRRWPWVDPLKDLESAAKAVSLGTRSVSDIIRESGRDPEEVWAELAQDLTRLKALGLGLPDFLSTAAQPSEPAPTDGTPL